MTKTIVLVEDDGDQRLYLKEFLEANLDARVFEVANIRSLVRLNAADDIPPFDIAVVDKMVRWGAYIDDESVPDEVDAYLPQRGGIYCAGVLRDSSSERQVPIVLYTILSFAQADLDGPFSIPGPAIYLRKKRGSRDELLERVRSVLESE